MPVYQIKIKSENDYLAILDLLEGAEVQFNTRVLHSSSFPSLDNHQYFASIYTESDQIQSILSGFKDRIKIEERAKSTKKSYLKIDRFLAVILGITFLALLCLYIQVRHELNTTQKSKHFYTLGDIFTRQIMHNSYNHNIFTYYDHNQDFNYERLNYYNKKGALSDEYIDGDEDGFYEQIYWFGEGEYYSAIHEDRNKDGQMDRIVYFLESDDSLVLEDSDYNGYFVRVP